MPNVIVVVFNCIRMARPVASKKRSSVSACLVPIVPLAIGRDFVRLTFWSISRSHRSLMIHPAARMVIAPKKNSVLMYSVFASMFFRPPEASAMPHSPGSNSSQMPMGRSSRMAYA